MGCTDEVRIEEGGIVSNQREIRDDERRSKIGWASIQISSIQGAPTYQGSPLVERQRAVKTKARDTLASTLKNVKGVR